MKLTDLIERLQEIALEHPEARVLGASQQNYPLAAEITAITLDRTDESAPLLWLASGNAPYDLSPYAPAHAWDDSEVADEDGE